MNSIIERWGRYTSPCPKCLRIRPKVCGNRVCIIRRRTCLKDPPEAWKGDVQGPRCERCFPRTLHDQSIRSFLWSGFVFSRITIPLRFLHHQSSWNRLCDSSEFINNEKKFLFQKPLSEWMCLHFRFTIRKNRPRIPLTTTNPSQPGPFFKHHVNQTPAGWWHDCGDRLEICSA